MVPSCKVVSYFLIYLVVGERIKKPVPLQEQTVKDAKGRYQRFHGAFTGGFSAGYFNTVGTKEGQMFCCLLGMVFEMVLVYCHVSENKLTVIKHFYSCYSLYCE